ncbi:ABC transporter ATP-binding protein [Pontibacillus marinus]|uniref:Cobalt ABC transporter n=1 Tax=Pontibacillus marinus BH030004 = DSM 16465 TaxID=1385511 RepID=A0A0A5GEM0_9BACI|nr:ABC transporter ATP-binding protein [Pontibacillus marinus]KGX89663.1 cobalt ABC transporter [Pontibacillus marinus BH030004 = DSM 16465]
MKLNKSPNLLIDVQDLSLYFEEAQVPVLSEISFQLQQRENVLLLGPSGCGKSTLTFCLNGIYPSELDGRLEGEVSLNGKPTSEFSPGELSQKVGVVFQDPEGQFCMMTVEDEVAFGLENIGVPVEEMEERIDQVLDLVNLLPYKEQSIHSLSGGMKQKLALACVLALQPDVLILDEPTANLDPLAKKDFIQTIQFLQQKQPFSMIVIEHQLEGWIPLIDRSLIMNKQGEIFYEGPLRNGIQQHVQFMKEQGICLPKATELALQSEIDRAHLPLTVEELKRMGGVSVPPKKRTYHDQPVILQAENIEWSKGNERIIDNMNFSLREGEFMAIVGANGSGKTSFSRILSRLETRQKGSIDLFGKALQSWREAELRRKIGYVFQNPEHQFITDQVYDEIAYSLRLQNKSEEEIAMKVQEVLRQCQLDGLEYRHPFTLSQGQKRRLSVAIMAIEDPAILILDEPTFGQDGRSTEEIMNLLSRKNEEDTAIVMITHDMELVHDYADRVVVFESGKTVFDGVPQELWNKPSDVLESWHLERPIQAVIEEDEGRKVNRHASSTT